MKLRNLSVVLLLAVMTAVFYSCKGTHACEGDWEGGGNSRYNKQYARLSVKDDGTFDLRIFPVRPDVWIQIYTGEETSYSGEWKPLSENEIELISSRTKARLSNGTEHKIDVLNTFYLRKDGAFCKDNHDFSSQVLDLMKME